MHAFVVTSRQVLHTLCVLLSVLFFGRQNQMNHVLLASVFILTHGVGSCRCKALN